MPTDGRMNDCLLFLMIGTNPNLLIMPFKDFLGRKRNEIYSDNLKKRQRSFDFKDRLYLVKNIGRYRLGFIKQEIQEDRRVNII
jgi:hypothetical protein